MKYKIEEVYQNIIFVNESDLDAFYIVVGDTKALLIDTGTGIGSIKEIIKEITDKPLEVVLTHGHVDHAGGSREFEHIYVNNRDMQKAKNVTVKDRKAYIGEMFSAKSEKERIEIPQWSNIQNTQYQKALSNQFFDLGNKLLRVIELPGHTEGSICLWDETDKILFSGDSFNPILLLEGEHRNYKLVLADWLAKAKACLNQINDVNLICAGHGLLTMKDVESIMECARKAVNGEIEFERKPELPIFHTEFVQDKNYYICCDRLDNIFD